MDWEGINSGDYDSQSDSRKQRSIARRGENKWPHHKFSSMVVNLIRKNRPLAVHYCRIVRVASATRWRLSQMKMAPNRPLLPPSRAVNGLLADSL